MNGYDFFKEALQLTNFRLDPILRILKYCENEWLEFKADFIAESGTEHTSVDKNKLRWNVSKAVFSLANTLGGAVIIGINDSGFPINLLKNHEADKDKVSRKAREQIVAPTNRKWSDGKYQWQSSIFMEQNVEYIWCTAGGVDVLTLLIKPQEIEPIILSKIDGNKIELYIPMRNIGDIGESILHPRSDNALALFKKRDLSKSKNNFHAILEELNKYKDRDIEEVIKNKNTLLVEELKEQLILFTQLDVIIKKLSWSSTNKTDSSWVSALSSRPKTKSSIENLNATDTLLKLNNSLLLGEPGAGKTTLMAKVALQLASQKIGSVEPIILRGNLAEYSDLGLQSLLTNIKYGIEWLDLIPIINSDRTTILLDSLNECPTQFYQNCLLDIAQFKTLIPNAKFIISSRDSHPFEDEAFSTIEIQSLSKDKQIDFLEKYLGHKCNDAPELQKKLINSNKSTIFMGNPILLKMVAWLHTDDQNIPDGLAELYSGFLKGWFYREKAKIVLRGESIKWNFDEFREILAELAFNLKNHGRTYCSFDFAKDKISNKLDTNELARFFQTFAQGLVIETDSGNKNIKFSHETILEYFAAEYLVSCKSLKLITNNTTREFKKWDYVIAFAYELEPLPSLEFIETSWLASPLIVAASLRNDDLFKNLPIPYGNFWETGIIKLLRGESTFREEEEIIFAARLPPKYPLPKILVDTLNSSSFWYALESHPSGINRLQTIIGKILEGGMWCELLPLLSNKIEYFTPYLNDVHISIATSQAKKIDPQQLKLATVYELCMLLREKNISISSFREHWSDALSRSTSSIKTDIIMLLRTNEVEISQINNNRQATELKEIGNDQRLSPRLHNKLIRAKVIDSEKINNDRLDDIFERSSIMNLVRYTKNRVITHKSLNSKRLSILNKKINTESELNDLLKAGLVEKSDFSEEFINTLSSGKIKAANANSGDLQKGISYEQLLIEIQEQENEIKSQNLSSEEKVINKIILDMDSAENQLPGSGFHSTIISVVKGTEHWPSHLKYKLYQAARKFILDHGSKKKKKEYLKIIEDCLN